MQDFKFKRNKLFCEQVSLQAIADKLGTPLFVYSYNGLISSFNALKQAFSRVSPLICYSVKVNSNLSVCRVLAQQGAGMDIVSGGELFRAKKIKVPGKKIVYSSVGKTEAEIEAGIKAGILFFNAESVPELELINKTAFKLGKIQKVAVRINPDVEAYTHRYITTAKKQNKFGIDLMTSRYIFLTLSSKFKNLDLCGIHMHIGSQILKNIPFAQAMEKAVKLITELSEKGVKITHLNIGGGIGIVYNQEKALDLCAYASSVIKAVENIDLKLILEPGRFIAGNAGVLLAKILYIKQTPVKHFIIVDTAMNDLIRPAFYQAYHQVIPVCMRKKTELYKTDIVGPVCESSDFLAKDRFLPDWLKQNDLLAVMSAGAYGFVMSSNYNSRPRAAEVLVKADKYYLIRKRDSFGDLVGNEIVCNV